MKGEPGKYAAGIAGILLLTAGLWAQTAAPLGLSTLTKKAGMIFAGEVIRIERVPPVQAGGEAAMQVTFRVTQAVHGTRIRQTEVLREWEGLWRHRGEHYRVGEHVMLFLHPSNKEGWTSPVGGRSGCFDIDRQNNVVLRPEQIRMIATTLPAKAVTIRHGGPNSTAHRRVKPTVRYQDFLRIVREATAP